MILINVDMFGNLKPMVNMDTYNAFKKLVHAGLEEKVAEAVIGFVADSKKSESENISTKSELKSEIANVRTEIADVRSDIKVLNTKFDNMRWVMGAILSMTTAILVKLFVMG